MHQNSKTCGHVWMKYSELMDTGLNFDCKCRNSEEWPWKGEKFSKLLSTLVLFDSHGTFQHHALCLTKAWMCPRVKWEFSGTGEKLCPDTGTDATTTDAGLNTPTVVHCMKSPVLDQLKSNQI